MIAEWLLVRSGTLFADFATDMSRRVPAASLSQ